MVDRSTTQKHDSAPHAHFLVDEMALVQKVHIHDVFTWLSKGWQETLKAPYTGMIYAALFVLVGLYISFGFYWQGLPYLILPALSGFLLVGPTLAVGFYEISRRRLIGQEVSLKDALFGFRRNSYAIMGMGVAQVFLFMVWIRLSFTLFAIAFPGVSPDWATIFNRAMTIEGLHFAAMITGLGAAFAIIIFYAGAFSLALMLDRPKTVLIPAMLASAYAVYENFPVMIIWASLIVLIMGLGLITGFGLILTFPIIGHASWHAYRQVMGRD